MSLFIPLLSCCQILVFVDAAGCSECLISETPTQNYLQENAPGLEVLGCRLYISPQFPSARAVDVLTAFRLCWLDAVYTEEMEEGRRLVTQLRPPFRSSEMSLNNSQKKIHLESMYVLSLS